MALCLRKEGKTVVTAGQGRRGEEPGTHTLQFPLLRGGSFMSQCPIFPEFLTVFPRMGAWPLQMVLCFPGSKGDDKNIRSCHQQPPHRALLKSHRNATSPVWSPQPFITLTVEEGKDSIWGAGGNRGTGGGHVRQGGDNDFVNPQPGPPGESWLPLGKPGRDPVKEK